MLRLTQEREKLKLTMFKLGALVEIHPAEISRLESGRTKPYEKWQRKLERFFDVPADELFKEV